MEILKDYKQLVGKTIAFSHMAEFAEQITIGTEDGCILMATMEMDDEDFGSKTRIRVLNPLYVKRVLDGSEWMRKELSELGIFDLESYKEEERIKREKEKKEYQEKKEAQERVEFARLKAKFNNE